MICRVTTWTNSRDEIVQVEHAVLSDIWEPLVRNFLPVGPFDDATERLALARARSLEWYELHGEQAALFDG